MKSNSTLMKILQCLFWIVICCTDVSCSGQGTTQVGNPTAPTISVSQLTSDGGVSVEMTLGVFGTSLESLDGATFGIHVNGETFRTGMAPVDFYIDASETIEFALTDLSDSDLLRFVIHLNDGTTVNYEATVSLETAVEASEVDE